MQGRLMGKRVDAEYFLESSASGQSTEGCNYLLANDMDMDPVPGYEMASWERGYGDFELITDFTTLRRIPWSGAAALVLADVAWGDGSPVRPSSPLLLIARLRPASILRLKTMFSS